MVEITGNVAKLYVGYRVGITLRQWKLIKKDEPLGNIAVQGTGVVDYLSPFWSHGVITKASFRLNSSWWTWRQVDFYAVNLKVEDNVEFRLIGDPDII
jgi:hypothetical protein